MSAPDAVSPAHDVARLARNAAELVLLSVREIPLRFDRPAVGERLKRAIDCLYATLDSGLDSPAHMEGLIEGGRALAEARELLTRAGDPASVPPLQRAVTILENAGAQLAPVAERVAQMQISRRMSLRRERPDKDDVPVRPFRASLGLPQLHALGRPPIHPEIPLEPIVPIEDASSDRLAPPPAMTLEQLTALASAAASGGGGASPPGMEDDEDEPLEPPPLVVEYAYDPAIEEREVIRQLARSALEDIAALSTLRHPIPTETWLDQAPFEQRLLNNLDYLISLGGHALAMVPLYHAESETPDPARAFAVAWTLGCVEGRDAAYSAVATFKVSPPEEFPGWVEGWSLAPSPAVDEAVRDLLGHPKARLAGVAVEVLAARGTLPADAPAWLLDRGDSELSGKVAKALGRALPRDAAISLLERLLQDHTPDDVFLPALTSAMRRASRRARDVCRRLVSKGPPARADAAGWLLSLAGHSTDAPLLIEAAQRAPTAVKARGLGRFGHVEAVPVLGSLLRSEDEAIAGAAAEALDLLTGAGLRESVEEPWELSLPPEAREMTDLPRPMRKIARPVRDPAAWRAWWERERARFDPRVKWRGGRPFVPEQIVDELEAAQTPIPRRGDAALELAVATGMTIRFSPEDWVARQKRHLAEIREEMRRVGAQGGAWAFGGPSL